MPRQNLVSISPYPVGHGKNGGGGGTTIIMGGQGSGNSKNLTVHSINASKGNIDNLRVKSLSANDADILYLMTQEGQIIKLKGDTLNYNAGYIGSLQSDEITAKKLNVDDIEAVNAWIKTLQSESITTEYLTVTKQAHFFELVIDKIRSVGGQLIISPASCVVDWVWGVINGEYVKPTAENLSEITAFDVFWRSTEDTGRSVDQEFLPLDQVICQSFNNVSTGVNYDVANKYYWRLVDAVYSNYGYVNLTTGAITQNSQAAINNKYNIAMLATQNKDEFDNYYNNEMIWGAAAQTIQGIQTNVQWQDTTLQEGQAINGVFSSSSQVYGMRIFPTEDNEQLNITSKLDFVIKQQVGEGFIIPDKINIGIYFTNDTYLVFNNVSITNEGNLTLDLENPNIPGLTDWKLEAPIEEIVIVSTADVNWHLCHRMTISNTDMDDMLSGYASIPSAGDNLVQLGYRGTDDQDRQSAIIISSRPTPDKGGQFDGRTLRPIYPPSYVQYKGIGSKETASENYDLYRFRQSFIDGRGASFVGDISMSTIGGKSIEETIGNIETKSKKILASASIIQVYTQDDANNPFYLSPSTINISILSPTENGGTETLTEVPEGYEVDLIYDKFATSDDIIEIYETGDSLENITLEKGTQVGDITKLRIILYKLAANNQKSVIDYKDLSYIKAQTGDPVDGSHVELRYKNAHNATDVLPLPLTGSDGFADTGANGWSKTVTPPDTNNSNPNLRTLTFMAQCTCSAAGVYGTWEGPFQLTGGNGKDGEDGTDIEFIYTTNDGVDHTNVPDPPSAPINDSQGNPVNTQPDWHGTDSNGVVWTDNPVGVSANVKFEYMAQRYKLPGSSTWTAYTTPCVWSNWGVKGMDGDGFEYIFLLSQENDPSEIDRLYNPTPTDAAHGGPWNDMNSQYQTLDEFARYLEAHKPSSMTYWWTDDPDSITSTYPYVYVAKRTKKRNGAGQNAIIPSVGAEEMVWTQFSTPSLWARYASQGSTGAHYEFRYCNFKPHTGQSKPTKPTTGAVGRGYYGNDSATYGGYWGDSVAEPDVNNGEYTFMSQCLYTPVENGSDYYGEWTEPFRITGGNGKDGEDGDSIEFIYKHYETTQTWGSGTSNPHNWGSSSAADSQGHTWNDTDYTGPASEGWSDNPTGIDTTNRFEYVAQRERIDGVWQPFTTPVIWSAYGEKGQDGDGYEYIYKCFPESSKQSEYTALTNAYNSNPASNYQKMDEYVTELSGWHDDPQSPTLGNPCWCSRRKRTNGSWGYYSEPAQWSMYITADGGTPGTPGENGKSDEFLIFEHQAVAMMVTALRDSNPVNLWYTIYAKVNKVDGATNTVVDFGSSQPYKMCLKAYNASNRTTPFWTRWITSTGQESGTPVGRWECQNLLTLVNANHSTDENYIDYMKCYANHSDNCPVTLQLELYNGGTLRDSVSISVIVESGAARAMMDYCIVDAVSKSHTDAASQINNWSTSTQTQEMFQNMVTSQMSNYATTSALQTLQTTTAEGFTSVTEQIHSISEDIANLGPAKVETVILKNLSQTSWYPVSIALQRYRISSQRIIVERYNDSSEFGSPNWGSTSSLVLDWNTYGSGSGSTWSPNNYNYKYSGSSEPDYPRFINKYNVYGTTEYGGIPADYIAGNIMQNPYYSCVEDLTGPNRGWAAGWSDEIVYLRGGSNYKITTDYENAYIKAHTSGYSVTGGGGTVSAPPITSKSDFHLPVVDAVTMSKIEQTVRSISLSVIESDAVTKEQLSNTGIDITAGNIQLRADKVTFTSSDGKKSGKIKIDPNDGSLIAEGGGKIGVWKITDTGMLINYDSSSSGIVTSLFKDSISVGNNNTGRHVNINSSGIHVGNPSDYEVEGQAKIRSLVLPVHNNVTDFPHDPNPTSDEQKNPNYIHSFVYTDKSTITLPRYAAVGTVMYIKGKNGTSVTVQAGVNSGGTACKIQPHDTSATSSKVNSRNIGGESVMFIKADYNTWVEFYCG